MKIPSLTEHRPGPGSLVSAQRRLPSEKGGGGQPVTTAWGGRCSPDTTFHLWSDTQAIPLEKPGLKSGKCTYNYHLKCYTEVRL